MPEHYKTPDWKSREYLDQGTALVIVHANSQHDPDQVSKKPIQRLIDSDIADYIYEFMAFHESFVRHNGMIIDNNRSPGDYHIDNLAGQDYILVGGGLGCCHFGAYTSLLSARFTRKTRIHLPADSIYLTSQDYESGETFLSSEIGDLAMKEFRRYKSLAGTISNGYTIKQDNMTKKSAGDKRLELILWSTTEMMMQYLRQTEKVKT